MDNSTNAVPYQPYRSKRHSRTVSNLPSESYTIPPPATPPVVDPHQSPSHNGSVLPSVEDNEHPPDPKPQLASKSSQAQSLANGHDVSSPSTSASTPSSSKPTLSASTSSTMLEPASSSSISPTSTFRHVPLRAASTPHTSSPLRPGTLHKPSSHSLTTSPSFSRQSSIRHIGPQQRPPLQDQRSRIISNATNSRVLSQDSQLSVPVISPSPVPSISYNPPQILPTASTSAAPPPAVSPSPSPSPALSSPAQSATPSPTPSISSFSRRTAAPYRPGFQPKGIYRPRTDEFLSARSSVRDRDKIEQRRLERRLEKLIALHFPLSPSSSQSLAPEKEKEKPPSNRRSSLLFDIDFRKNPTELWRDVVELRIQGLKADIRAEEQNITPWEDDAAVSQCPLCTTSFHPLTNRKHHCRLCGRIICSLPPRPPTRVQPCSLLFVVDQRTGNIEEVGEGVDYGVKRRASTKGKGEEEDKFLKGVRICRDCRTVLLRQQYLQEASRVPAFARLYAKLVVLEKDIEDALPQFQELVLSFSTSNSSQNAPSTTMRKRLLDSFGEYDRLAKRIGQLPVPRGGSQDRVQSAILMRANLFLQKNMFPLQTLPKPQKQSSADSPRTHVVDADSQLAHRLQPLLEQEALLESFVEEARAQRKFEDARTLKANLGEIRGEIERIAQEGSG